ncbi:hypothetical protein U9M48_021569 [Paspalum notatum var. saurae]|uniref:Uncharacterized protein n=1 Tax=Paspalum notatum var. saurae TaxID=547442 RepID=A0AAQ3WTW8_PASNO
MASKFFRASSPVLAAAVLLIVVAASAQAQEAPAPSPTQAALCPSGVNTTLASIERIATQLQGQVVYALVNSPLMNSTVDGVVTGLRGQYPTQEICVCAPNIGRIPPNGGTGPIVTYICSRG